MPDAIMREKINAKFMKLLMIAGQTLNYNLNEENFRFEQKQPAIISLTLIGTKMSKEIPSKSHA